MNQGPVTGEQGHSMENLATSKKTLLEIKDAKYILYLEDGYLAIKKKMEFVRFPTNSTAVRLGCGQGWGILFDI